jgi:hypothetical protein
MYILLFAMIINGKAEVWNVETRPMTKLNCQKRLEEVKSELKSLLADGLQCVYISPEKNVVIQTSKG